MPRREVLLTGDERKVSRFARLPRSENLPLGVYAREIPTAGGLVLRSSGLVAWNEPGTSRPFVLADWAAYGLNAGNPGGGGVDALAYSGVAFNQHVTIALTVVADRTTWLVQTRTANNSPAGAIFAGPACSIVNTGNTGTSSVEYVGHRSPRGLNDNHGVNYFTVAGGGTPIASNYDVRTLAQDTYIIERVYNSPTQIASYSDLLALGYSAAAVIALGGKPGFFFQDALGGGTGQEFCTQFVACTDRYVTINAQPYFAGYIARVRDSVGATVAQALFNGSGIAQIDMLPYQIVSGAWRDVAVYNPPDTALLSAYAPGGDGVMPGDVYDFLG